MTDDVSRIILIDGNYSRIPATLPYLLHFQNKSCNRRPKVNLSRRHSTPTIFTRPPLEYLSTHLNFYVVYVYLHT